MSVLAQILVLRQNQEGGVYTSKHTTIYITIWEKVLTSLTNAILEPSETNDDDLNVEHTQLLLFLFHALALMQKKQVLLLTALSVCKSAKVVNR